MTYVWAYIYNSFWFLLYNKMSSMKEGTDWMMTTTIKYFITKMLRFAFFCQLFLLHRHVKAEQQKELIFYLSPSRIIFDSNKMQRISSHLDACGWKMLHIWGYWCNLLQENGSICLLRVDKKCCLSPLTLMVMSDKCDFATYT